MNPGEKMRTLLFRLCFGLSPVEEKGALTKVAGLGSIQRVDRLNPTSKIDVQARMYFAILAENEDEDTVRAELLTIHEIEYAEKPASRGLF